jgi:N-acetyl-anhydromuramyl-L-alanine amidase AmpD
MKYTISIAVGFALSVCALTNVSAGNRDVGLSAEQRTQIENARMADIRVGYPSMFAKAYARYPQIPAGTLEAIAYTKTRWNPVVPDAQLDADSAHMGPVYGIMGLGVGLAPFVDQVGEAAALTGFSVDQIKFDTQTNIIAAASLIARDLGVGSSSKSLEQSAHAIRRAMGLNARSKSSIDQHLQDSFAFSVLSVLDRGQDDHGVRIKAREVAFEKVFSAGTLATQKAAFVRLNVAKDRVETSEFLIEPISETIQSKANVSKSTDYGPALFQQSPNESARSANPTHVTIHQMEGYYAGSIATFLQVGGVSAHYLIRDSDGQVTQMVRESRKGAHVKSHNDYSIGIEQEGFRGQSNWYSNATYREVIAITRNICARWAIPCSSVYRGTATDSEIIQATSLRIKGHQHFPDQFGTRTDPGRFFSWTRFADGINASSAFQGVMDSFETNEGRFADEPAISGSTTGISSASIAERNSARVRSGGGSWSEQIGLVDNTATSANWNVRFLSGGGNPANNVKLQKAGGRLGFWAFTAAPGVSLAMGVDDSDGTERSIAKTLPGNVWTFVEWKLDDQTQWDAWVGGDGIITASQVTLDAIWFSRSQNANPVYIYIDDVQFKIQ